MKNIFRKSFLPTLLSILIFLFLFHQPKTLSFAQQTGWKLIKEQTGTQGYDVLIKNVGAGDFDINKIAVWHYDRNNPQLVAHPGGDSNIYAADLVQNGGAWNLYYGGWDGTTDKYDRISIGVSYQGLSEAEWTGRFTIIDHGSYRHANDPSVVRISGNEWYMAYTAAKEVGRCYRDWINISTSQDGASWQPNSPSISNEIILHNAPTDLQDIARPSLLKDRNNWKLYFDRGGVDNAGCPPNYASVYLATSQDLKNFYYQRKVSNGNDFAVEPDVEKFGNTYLMVTGWFENGIFWAISNDGKNFTPHKKLFGKSGQVYDRLYTTNPGIVRQGNRLLGIWYGAHTNVLTDAKIAAAYLQKEAILETQGSVIKNAKSLGPDNLVLRLPSQEVTGIFKIYDSDGTTLLFQSEQMTVRGGDIYRLEVGENQISLSPGWNQITWPDIFSYTAKTALGDIDNDCGIGTAIVISQKTKDWWRDFVKNYGGENFNLQSNQNYFINVSKNCNWVP